MSNIQICKLILALCIIGLAVIPVLIHREVGRLTREELDMMFDDHNGEDK